MTFSVQATALTICLLSLPRSICSRETALDNVNVKGSIRTFPQRQHRSLADFLMPFQITWRFNIAEGAGFPSDRQPTDAEYEGIRQANMDWFAVEIPLFYADETSFSFQNIDCTVTDTTYDPAASEEDWVHTIVQACEVVWDADTIEDLPPVPEFLVDMNADYLLDNFVANHLRSADPQDPRSLFQFASRVGYVTTTIGTTSPLPGNDTPAPSMGGGPGPVPTEAPIMPPTGDTPGSPTSVPQRKEAPPAKCGSLAGERERGGAAAQAKDCSSGRLTQNGNGGRRKRKLKGSYN